MPRFETTTYGFGRVSPVTRPSPYSLVELRGRPLHPALEPADPHERWRYSSEAARRGARRDNLRRGLAAFFALVAVIGATTFIVGAREGRQDHEARALASVVKPPPPAPPLSEEALRLTRSAIAVARYVPRR